MKPDLSIIQYGAEAVSLALAASEAAGKIKAVLPRDRDGGVRRTDDPAAMTTIAEIVHEAVIKAGGDASALFALTSVISKLVPYGARVLRSLRAAYCRETAVDGTAAALVELMAGDIAADFLNAGKQVDRLLRQCGSAFESDVLAALAARLQVSARTLRQFHDAYLVSLLGGSRLTHLAPAVLPYPVLSHFAPIIKADLMPWRAQALIVKAAEEVARRGLTGKRVDSLVRDLLAQGPDKDEAPARVLPAWNIPSAPARGTEAVQPAA